MKFRFILLFLLFLGVRADAALAQFPGGALVGPGRMRYEFLQRVQIDLSAYLREWERGWGTRARGIRQLRDHYTNDAVIVSGEGLLIRGRDGVRRHADEQRERTLETAVAMTDWDASDDVAFVYGPYAITPREGTGTPDNGHMTGILFKDRDRWRFRTQLYMPRDTGLILRTGVGTALMQPYMLNQRANANVRRRYSEAVTLSSLLRFAWNDRDTTRFHQLLADNPLLLLPGSEGPLRGTNMIEGELADRMADLGTWTSSIVDFDTRARFSYLLGRYHMRARGGPRTGLYLMVVSTEENEPRLRALIFH